MLLLLVRLPENEEYLNADRSTLNLVLSVRLSITYNTVSSQQSFGAVASGELLAENKNHE